MVRMEAHAASVGTEIISDIITSVDLNSRPFVATGDSGTIYTSDALILATGAQARWLGLDSEEKFKGFGRFRMCDMRWASFIGAKMWS